MTFILSISGFLIVGFLGIISFFFKRLVRQNDLMGDDISEIKITIERSITNIENLRAGCHDRHLTVDHRLNEHAKRINLVEKDVEVIKSKI